MTDEEIVLIVRSKNLNRYVEIIERYEIKLMRYLRKFITSIQDIEDLLQEIFLKAFQNLNGFDVAKKFSSWIYRIAHNEAVNFLKKLKIQTVNLDEVEFILFDSSNDFAKYFDLKIEKQKVESALAKLNFKYLDPLVLHYFEDKSYEEIAEILKIPKKDDV